MRSSVPRLGDGPCLQLEPGDVAKVPPSRGVSVEPPPLFHASPFEAAPVPPPVLLLR